MANQRQRNKTQKLSHNGTTSPTLDPALPVFSANEMAWLQQQSLGARMMLFGRYGLQYDGRRDLKDALGYLKNLDFNTIWEYSIRGLGARIVEVFPKDTWGQVPEVRENDDPENVTPFEQDWEALVKQHDVWGYFYDLDVLAQVGEYGVLLYGIDGVQDYAVPIEQQTNAQGPESLLYLRTYRQNRAQIKEYVADRFSADYAMPSLYELETRQQSPDGSTFTEKFFVHPSHLLHFADNTRENRVLGIPILWRVVDALFDLQKTMGGISEMTWRDAKRRIVQELKDGATLPDPVKTEQNIAAFAHDMKDWLITGGSEIKSLDGTIPNIEGNLQRLMQLIAGILDYPMRRLFGSEQGQLATDQDNRIASQKILQRYHRIIEPRIIRPFIDKMIAIGVLSAPQDDYEIVLPDLLALTKAEQADVDRKYVQNLREYVGPMGNPETIVTREEFRTLGLSQWQLSAEPEGGFLFDDFDRDDPSLEVDDGD